ncbi:MAG: YggT family protein [Chloroflexi bacterium]|nr:YggT family protein [Chloroflexota bacterium]
MVELIDLLGKFFYFAIFARIILSWFPTSGKNPIVLFVFAVTEPILAPIRRMVPRFGSIDISPMIALIGILIIQWILTAIVA